LQDYKGFYFRPAEGEQVFSVLRPEAEKHAAVLGRVVDTSGRGVTEAQVLLFRAEEKEYIPLCCGCTDSAGYFAFGPLEPGKLYYIRLCSGELHLRELTPEG